MAFNTMSFSFFRLTLAFIGFVLVASTLAADVYRSRPSGEPWWVKRNRDTIDKLYGLVVYPNQLPIIAAGAQAVPPGLFNANSSGRITPVGEFIGLEESTEYFFGLSPVPESNVRSTVFARAETVAFQSPCAEVASSIIYLHSGVVNPNSTENGKEVSTLKQIAFWRFDEQGAVLNYDAWLPTIDAWNEVASGAQVENPSFQAATIQGLCGVIQTRCVGNNTQYQTVEECIDVLSQKPFGIYDRTWGDNVVCRAIHSIFTLSRPSIHCPHVGPTGGGKCSEESYNTRYFNDEELFGRPAGTTFVCDQSATYQ